MLTASFRDRLNYTRIATVHKHFVTCTRQLQSPSSAATSIKKQCVSFQGILSIVRRPYHVVSILLLSHCNRIASRLLCDNDLKDWFLKQLKRMWLCRKSQVPKLFSKLTKLQLLL